MAKKLTIRNRVDAVTAIIRVGEDIQKWVVGSDGIKAKVAASMIALNLGDTTVDMVGVAKYLDDVRSVLLSQVPTVFLRRTLVSDLNKAETCLGLPLTPMPVEQVPA
jgi:hypothetical protein